MTTSSSACLRTTIISLLTLTLAIPVARADVDLNPNAPLAQIGNEQLTTRDASEAARSKQLRLQAEHDRQIREYDVAARLARDEAWSAEADRLINERVLALEAKARRSTPEKLLEQIKVPPVTAQEARTIYDEHAREIKQPYESVEQAIFEELAREHKLQAKQTYLKGLRNQYGARSLVEPTRFTVDINGPTLGPKDAPVTLVLFADFQCPYCAKLIPQLNQALQAHPNDLKLVYRHMPLGSIHPQAMGAALAAVCADQQGKFWPAYAAFYTEPSQASLAPAALRTTVLGLGVDAEAYDACLKAPQTADIIKTDSDLADNLGLTGTPALFVNGRLLRGSQPTDKLLAIIDEELQQARSTKAR